MKKILFFDGVCAMCNTLVNFTIKKDKNNQVNFAPLQGSTAKELIPDYSQSLNTVVFYEEGRIYTESDAILKLYKTLGGIYSLLYAFIIIPKFVRDNIYRFIAKNRYKWFGKNDACQLYSPKERAKILD